MTQNLVLNPVAPSGRIASLDLLRGITALGILIMNIQSFSMIGAAYMNPTAWGELTGINKWVWIVMLMISPLWLKHFRFGPLEWLWRVLTYMKMQPVKRPSKSEPSNND
jgi:uncharacterized membrane protein YeiB